MTLPGDDFGRVTHIFEGSGLVNRAIVQYAVEFSVGSIGDQTMVEALADELVANIIPRMANTVGLVSTELKVGPDETGPTFVSSQAGVGGSANAQAPANCAWLVHKITAQGGRRGRGRLYFPGVTETVVGPNGDLSDTDVGLWQTNLNNWRDDIRAISGIEEMSLEHFPGSGSTPAPTAITQLVMDGHCSTQRRRMRR